MKFSYLPDAENHPLWPQIYQLLEPAAKYGDIEVWEEGDLVWIAFDGPTIYAAAVTRPLGDEAELTMVAGTRLMEWLGLLDSSISAWAASNGARRVNWRGRKGWARFANRFGWQVIGEDDAGRTLYVKEL